MNAMLNQWQTTKSGARYTIIREKTGSWSAVRDDGVWLYRAHSFPGVEDYMLRYGDVIEPAPSPTPNPA